MHFKIVVNHKAIENVENSIIKLMKMLKIAESSIKYIAIASEHQSPFSFDHNFKAR